MVVVKVVIFCFVVLSLAQSVHTANNGAPPAVKKVQKNFNNYASVECGAKILGANPEAKVLHVPSYDTRQTCSRCLMTVKLNLLSMLYCAEHFRHTDGEHGPVHAQPL